MAEVPFKEGFFTTPLSPYNKIRFNGVKCKSCGSLQLGKQEGCINCTSKDIEPYVFSNHGKVWAHTVIRHAPPPPYPQETFKPFPAAWVELDDHLLVISEVTNCGLEEIKTGMPVELVVAPQWKDDKGNDVLMYKFKAIK